MSSLEKKRGIKEPETSAMPFRKGNYRLLIIGVLILLMGYALLLQPAQFVDSRMFSAALYIAPWVIVGGFGILIYAILKK
ncbi:MAG: DUF3098 domain-containing protein [Bacteroidia bacterium]|nr:DUF3098 domain-containing protein [Bacteroidia bacterium]MDW8133491.1 DUF3098 domain-containing protein [Bacteroidia bacterium]